MFRLTNDSSDLVPVSNGLFANVECVLHFFILHGYAALGGSIGSRRWENTWLILPAVICSDKRLSHACLKKSTQLNLRTDDSKSVSSEDSSTHEHGNVHS